MKVKIHEVLTRKNRYKRLVFILVLFSLVLLVGILGFGLTKEKEKKVQMTEQFSKRLLYRKEGRYGICGDV